MVGLPAHHQASLFFFIFLSFPTAGTSATAKPTLLCNSTRLISAAAKFPWNSISLDSREPSTLLSQSLSLIRVIII